MEVNRYLNKEDKDRQPLTEDTTIQYDTKEQTIILQLTFDQSIKQRHYWIYSIKPNYGKTTFTRNIQKQFKHHTYFYDTEQHF